MLIEKTFTHPASWPRSTKDSLLYSDAHLDVAYSIWHDSDHLPEEPRHTKMNIVFLHGSQFVRQIWNYMVELAFKEFGSDIDKCITIDAVTHGDSALLNAEKVNYFAAWDDLGRDAGEIIKHLRENGEIEGPVVIYGHSMGGCSALVLAGLQPALVQGVVVMDPVWGGTEGHFDNIEIPTKLASAVYRNARETFKSHEEYLHFMNRMFISSKFHPRIKKDMTAHCGVQTSDGVWRMKQGRALQAGAYYSVRSVAHFGNTLFRNVRQPSLIIHGDIQDWNPKGSNELLETVLPHAERVLMTGGGHLIMFQKPDECFSMSIPFMRRTLQQAQKTSGTGYLSPSANKNFESMVQVNSQGSKL